MTDPIVVVEDDPAMRRLLRTTLVAHGFAVTDVATIADARRAVADAAPVVVVLDLALPDGDGVDLVRELRGWTRVPIIVISARDREDDKVEALDAGADDYLTKPFGVGELLARIRVARRHARAVAGEPDDAVVTVGPIRIDHGRREVTVDGAAVHLTPTEYALLAALIAQAGKVLTHRQLLREVWGNAVVETHSLRVHMAALRRKVERDPARPHWLLTEPGVGYRLREPDD